MPFKIGLTGGIASGKTTVSDQFAKLQVPVIDADIIAHQLVQPGQPALETLKEVFGQQIINLDGQLNREKLRNQVFNNVAARKKLEAILHPRIRTLMLKQAQQVTFHYCILSIPLLLETQQMEMVDRILVVDCDIELQRRRLSQRSGFSETEIDNMLAAQVQRHERLAIADDVIHNDKERDYLIQQVVKLHQIYLQL